MSDNMFEKAIRMKLRYDFRGVCSVEDLWDLNLNQLDLIYKSLNAQLKQQQEESLLSKKNKEETELDLKLEIVKHVFNTLSEEKNKKKNAALVKEQREKLLTLIQEKKDDELKNKSIEDLKKMYEEVAGEDK